jgi:5-methyltetrahydrofolate--homocysteine methyltransferase
VLAVQQLRGREHGRDGAPARTSWKRARTEGADIIGLSGLITPSAGRDAARGRRDAARRVLPHAAARRCSSAAPPRSRVHTAVKIARRYEGPVVYVPDASRSVGVCSDLLSAERAEAASPSCRPTTSRCAGSTPARKVTPLVTLAAGPRQPDAAGLGQLHAAAAGFHRPARAVKQRGPGRNRRAASTGARSSRPGTWPGRSPRS